MTSEYIFLCSSLADIVVELSSYMIQCAIPVFVGVVLYADDVTDDSCKVILCIAVVISCYTFMTVVNRLPMIGLYSNMMSKVSLRLQLSSTFGACNI